MNARGTVSTDWQTSVRWPVTIEVGRADITFDRACRLADGSILELDRAADSEVDLFVDGRLIARGHLVSVGQQAGITITEVHGLGEVRA
jgi:flagellar motor switch protein FliN/FliY